MPGGKLALAGVDVAIVEQRASQKLGGSRAGGLHSGTVEIPDQRGMATAMITHRGRARAAAGWVSPVRSGSSVG